jgi:hypothetical protein
MSAKTSYKYTKSRLWPWNFCLWQAHPASFTVITVGPFPAAKARSGRDADHSPPYNAEVENEYS